MKMTLFLEKPLRNNVSIMLFLVSVLSRINLYEYQICSSLIQITFTSTVGSHALASMVAPKSLLLVAQTVKSNGINEG
jgi:hypothetical protein